MNKYQKSLNDIKLDENAKRRVFHGVRQKWDISREYRLHLSRMRTANILLAVFVTVLCVTNVAMTTVKPQKEIVDTVIYSGWHNYYTFGETFTCHDCFQNEEDVQWYGMDRSHFDGSFTWDGLYVAKYIRKGDKVYESNKDYFLIIKETLDMKEYSIKYMNSLRFSNIFSNFDIGEAGYDDTVEKTIFCEGATLGEEKNLLNVEVTRALSCDLAITEPPRAARGVAYICMDITRDMRDFLYFNTAVKEEGVDGIMRVGVPNSVKNNKIVTKEDAIERLNAWNKIHEEWCREHEEFLKEREKWKKEHEELYKEMEEEQKRNRPFLKEIDESDYYHTPPNMVDFTYIPSNLYTHLYLSGDKKRCEVIMEFYGYYEDIEYFYMYEI